MAEFSAFPFEVCLSSYLSFFFPGANVNFGKFLIFSPFSFVFVFRFWGS